MYETEEKLYFEKLKQAVIDMEEEEAGALAQEIVARNFSAKGAVEQGLIAGMEEVSRLYAQEKYFIPELLSCADAMYEALAILEEDLEQDSVGYDTTIVIGTVFGDTHDIGKNIVALFLKSAGFTVYDIGRDVPTKTFVENAIEYQADLIVMSTIMTTTMESMRDVINELEKQGIREQVKVMVGGKPVSTRFAREIGADGYSVNAAEAIKLAKKLSGNLIEEDMEQVV